MSAIEQQIVIIVHIPLVKNYLLLSLSAYYQNTCSNSKNVFIILESDWQQKIYFFQMSFH